MRREKVGKSVDVKGTKISSTWGRSIFYFWACNSLEKHWFFSFRSVSCFSLVNLCCLDATSAKLLRLSSIKERPPPIFVIHAFHLKRGRGNKRACDVMRCDATRFCCFVSSRLLFGKCKKNLLRENIYAIDKNADLLQPVHAKKNKDDERVTSTLACGQYSGNRRAFSEKCNEEGCFLRLISTMLCFVCPFIGLLFCVLHKSCSLAQALAFFLWSMQRLKNAYVLFWLAGLCSLPMDKHGCGCWEEEKG
ncbi:hypothetical protein BX070DRAFT_66041 [Coemansia spiralis]|nr:hypothetical protein BX070DRAFT_66041 [Coemansia spiralis]